MKAPRPQPDGRAFSAAGIRRFRRFSGYDYSRGASLFITFTLARRFAAFGRVEGAAVALSPAGKALAETIELESHRHPGLEIRACAIMPDHVHLRVTLAPGMSGPLDALGRFTGNIKRWAKWKAGKLGVEIEWAQGAHDRICNSREINETVDRYIANNPLKWSLMHGPNPPLAVIEPLDSPRLPDGEWWTAAGAAPLFAEARRIAAVRLSRRIPQAEFPAVAHRLLDAAAKGFVIASTFISPCERAVAGKLAAAGAAMIKAVPDALATVYRPKGEEPALFAEGRLLLLSRVAAPGISRSAAWHCMNAALAAAALACGSGVSLYVAPAASGRLEWRFETGCAEGATIRLPAPPAAKKEGPR